MADAYTGEIRIFAGNFAPYGWAFCDGKLLPIAQNTALYSILGTRYGGDGKTTFALPNLSGRAPMNQGNGSGLTPRTVGEQPGTPTVTLTLNEIPAHTHVPQGKNNAGASKLPTDNFWAESPKSGPPGHQTQAPLYNAAANVNMSPLSLSTTGESQPHNNMQPYLPLNYIICLNGLYPPHQ